MSGCAGDGRCAIRRRPGGLPLSPLAALFPQINAYLDALHQAGYFAAQAERPLLARVSDFLFGHPEALR
jgi:hypothetical protein